MLHKLMPAHLLVRIPMGQLRGKKWYFDSGTYKMVSGVFEKETVLLFSNLVRKADVIYDVGAHVGYYTLLSSELVGKNGLVVAFEPNPRNQVFLEKHLKLNYCHNVKIIKACLGDKTETVAFSTEDDSTTGRIRNNGTLKVEMTKLDDLVEKNIIPPPDFMKIDVEGAEILVLEGSKHTIIDYHPKIFLSTHSAELHIQCLKFLKANKYNLMALDHRELNLSDNVLAY